MFNVLRCCDQMVIVLFEQAVIIFNTLTENVHNLEVMYVY